jgi:hypothetical protein
MTASQAVRKAGVRSTHFYAASLGSIGLCISLWIGAKTVDQDERGNAERRALFVGLWPPMFWLMGDSLKDAGLVREQLLGRVDESAVLDELPRLEIKNAPLATARRRYGAGVTRCSRVIWSRAGSVTR